MNFATAVSMRASFSGESLCSCAWESVVPNGRTAITVRTASRVAKEDLFCDMGYSKFKSFSDFLIPNFLIKTWKGFRSVLNGHHNGIHPFQLSMARLEA